MSPTSMTTAQTPPGAKRAVRHVVLCATSNTAEHAVASALASAFARAGVESRILPAVELAALQDEPDTRFLAVIDAPSRALAAALGAPPDPTLDAWMSAARELLRLSRIRPTKWLLIDAGEAVLSPQGLTDQLAGWGLDLPAPELPAPDASFLVACGIAEQVVAARPALRRFQEELLASCAPLGSGSARTPDLWQAYAQHLAGWRVLERERDAMRQALDDGQAQARERADDDALVLAQLRGTQNDLERTQRALDAASESVRRTEEARVSLDAQLRSAQAAEATARSEARALQERGEQAHGVTRDALQSTQAALAAAETAAASARAEAVQHSEALKTLQSAHDGLRDRAARLASDLARLEQTSQQRIESIEHGHRQRLTELTDVVARLETELRGVRADALAQRELHAVQMRQRQEEVDAVLEEAAAQRAVLEETLRARQLTQAQALEDAAARQLALMERLRQEEAAHRQSTETHAAQLEALLRRQREDASALEAAQAEATTQRVEAARRLDAEVASHAATRSALRDELTARIDAMLQAQAAEQARSAQAIEGLAQALQAATADAAATADRLKAADARCRELEAQEAALSRRLHDEAGAHQSTRDALRLAQQEATARLDAEQRAHAAEHAGLLTQLQEATARLDAQQQAHAAEHAKLLAQLHQVQETYEAAAARWKADHDAHATRVAAQAAALETQGRERAAEQARASQTVAALEARVREADAAVARARQEFAQERAAAHERQRAQASHLHAAQTEQTQLLAQIHHVQEALEAAMQRGNELDLALEAQRREVGPPERVHALEVLHAHTEGPHCHVDLRLEDVRIGTRHIDAMPLRLVEHDRHPGLLFWDQGEDRVLGAWEPHGQEDGRPYMLLLPSAPGGRDALSRFGHLDWRLVVGLTRILQRQFSSSGERAMERWAHASSRLLRELEALPTRLRYDAVQLRRTGDSVIEVSFDGACHGERELGAIVLRWKPSQRQLQWVAPARAEHLPLVAWPQTADGRLQPLLDLPVGGSAAGAERRERWATAPAVDQAMMLALLDALPGVAHAAATTSLPDGFTADRLADQAAALHKQARRTLGGLRARALASRLVRRGATT